MSPQKIVVTGGPSTGKTSLIEAMQDSGYVCYPEVVRQMTLDAKNKGSLSNYGTNPIALVANPLDFNKKILDARLEQYRESEGSGDAFIFFDRGLPDVLAYMEYYKQEVPKEFRSIIKKHAYDRVFFLPIWQEIFVQDGERFESYEEAMQLTDCLYKTYSELNYDIIEIPKSSVVERVGFIKKIVLNDHR